jgi:hypothetical protein
MRPKSHPKKLSVFISLNNDSIHSFYNVNDPAPLQYRQLSYEFQDYLDASVASAGRNTLINYKIFCGYNAGMNFMVDPLIRSIKRHYIVKQEQACARFRRFKHKNIILLMIAFAVVMICQGLLPVILGQQHRIHSLFSNALDVFSWVILWKPIERLIFYWNPFLKDILLYEKMSTAQMLIIDNEQELINYHKKFFDAA